MILIAKTILIMVLAAGPTMVIERYKKTCFDDKMVEIFSKEGGVIEIDIAPKSVEDGVNKIHLV